MLRLRSYEKLQHLVSRGMVKKTGNNVHAVLEATKSLSDKIRKRTGLTGDAGQLAQKAFSPGASGIRPFCASIRSSQTSIKASKVAYSIYL